MSLTDSQKQTVADWVTEGKSLADIQHLLKEEFSVPMTYMEVRFLVDDLGVVFEAPTESDEAGEKVEEPEIVDEGGLRQVKVDVDAITPPGALVSGSVAFSDGVTLGWQLLSNGQLGLTPGDNPDYRPSPEDMQDFRSQMDEVLRKKGF